MFGLSVHIWSVKIENSIVNIPPEWKYSGNSDNQRGSTVKSINRSECSRKANICSAYPQVALPKYHGITALMTSDLTHDIKPGQG